MVSFKKQIFLILILSLFLSLIPNFLYNESREVFASEECKDVSCPSGCTGAVYDDRSETCVCINCSISCPWSGGTVINKSCVPLSGTGEWDCGVEIPIGEVVDGTTFLAEKMLTETLGIIKAGGEMADTADHLLTDYKKWQCEGFEDWENKEVKCETDCYKYFYIKKGALQPGGDPRCSDFPEAVAVPRFMSAKEECRNCNGSTDCLTKCNTCATCEEEECCWEESKEIEVPDPNPKHPGKTIKKSFPCKYCREEGSNPETGELYCDVGCLVSRCGGCCGQYFDPIINAYNDIAGAQADLKNDVEETNSPEKFKRSYILEQLEFSRCELAQCWMSAEEYPAVFAGEKVGKHLLTCEAVSQMEFLDEDQINCLSFQIQGEWEDIKSMWKEPKENWWKWLIAPFYIQGKIWKMSWMTIRGLIEERSNTGQEEGCYPHNFYCCQK